MKFYANSPDDRIITPLNKSLFTFYYKLYIENINLYPDKEMRYKHCLRFEGGNAYGYLFWDNTKQNCLNVLLSTEIMRMLPDKNAYYPKTTNLFHKTRHRRFSSTYLQIGSMYPKLGLLRVCFRGLRYWK